MKIKLLHILSILLFLVLITMILPVSAYAGAGDDNDSSSPEFGGGNAQDDGWGNYYNDTIDNCYDKLIDAGWYTSGSYTTGYAETWEDHYKSVACNGNDANYIDRVDLGWFKGHGNTFTGGDLVVDLKFSVTDHDDQYLEWYEASWGDQDLEWICLESCYVLNDSSLGYWNNAFNGLHLMCGASTEIASMWIDTGWPWDYEIYENALNVANLLIDDGWWDSARTVKNSWFEGMDYKQDSEVQLRVIAESGDCFDDCVWGQGPVCSDPSPDGTLYYVTYNCT